jgi:hypothetical protein
MPFPSITSFDHFVYNILLDSDPCHCDYRFEHPRIPLTGPGTQAQEAGCSTEAIMRRPLIQVIEAFRLASRDRVEHAVFLSSVHAMSEMC